jgi:flavin reductase (DIM6/NTAB) family NADH-FMN oxidoreductase RutF
VNLTETLGALTAALDYPMYVVTTAAGGNRAGCLVGFTTQCSIDPVRFLVCLSRRNHTCRVASQADLLAVHVLDREQQALAELFGTETGDDIDKLARCAWTEGPSGTPLLDDCPNRFLGRIVDRFDTGDHLAFLLDVVDAWSADPGPLLTFQSVRDLEPGHPA